MTIRNGAQSELSKGKRRENGTASLKKSIKREDTAARLRDVYEILSALRDPATDQVLTEALELVIIGKVKNPAILRTNEFTAFCEC